MYSKQNPPRLKVVARLRPPSQSNLRTVHREQQEINALDHYLVHGKPKFLTVKHPNGGTDREYLFDDYQVENDVQLSAEDYQSQFFSRISTHNFNVDSVWSGFHGVFVLYGDMGSGKNFTFVSILNSFDFVNA